MFAFRLVLSIWPSLSGIGSQTIAQRLNAEGIPFPSRKGVTPGWKQAGIRTILSNPIYNGTIVWGRIKTMVRKGREINVPQPKETWQHFPAPELKIVDDDLWQRVQARREAQRRAIPRNEKGRIILGKGSWRDGHSNYLWPGHGRCALCKGTVRISHRRHGAKRTIVRYYCCSTHDVSGPAICANNVLVLHDKLDRALIESLSETLDTRLLADAVDEALSRLREHHTGALDRKHEIDRELQAVAQKIDRLVDALADGSLPGDEIKKRLVDLTAHKQALTADLATLGDVSKVASLDVARIKRDLRQRVEDVRALLRAETQQARVVLRRLLDGPIVVTAFREGNRRGWRFKGRLVFDRLLTGEAATLLVNSRPGGASGTGATGGDTYRPASPLSGWPRPSGGEAVA